MDGPDERDRRIEELEERLARLSEASLSINESLDIETVLQRVLDSARTLTGARYGVIATTDVQGVKEAVLTSGTSEEEHRQLVNLPGTGKIFGHFLAIAKPLRMDDYAAYAASAGLNGSLPIAVKAGMYAPIRHLGQPMGVILQGHDQEGRTFSTEDEEILVMFSSQAAMVIANARRHREERRARADLETLVDTSPVGVVVLDAVTGAPMSVNREARRIVDSLRDPGQSSEDLLSVVTFRRADGREVSLLEFPVVEALRSGETLRAEEVVISVPDGRSVTLLLNATPIASDEGAVESVVVALQDMAEVQEQERLRAEFLGMVSHELRTPLTSIKGSASTIMDAGADLDPAVVRQFVRIITDQADHMNALVADLLDVARIETGALAVGPEPAEVAVLVDRARNGFANAGGRNTLEIDVEPDLPLVMADRRRVVQVLGNLLSNAARNSSEASVIRVSAARDGVHVAVSVSDEGRGIPPESLPLLFRKFSRAQSGEREEDTGLGLAICKGIVEAHGGRIWAESDGPGTGARFTFTLPSVEDPATGAAAVLPARPTRREQEEEDRRLRVLAVDDDPNDLRYVRDTLAKSGYDPILTGEPEDVVRLVEEEQPDLVLLDLMLPGTDGIELMTEILEVADVPVIFLSAYGREELIARAFDMGAADYVVKPFSTTELAARIRAALRRRAAAEPSEPYVLGGLTIDYGARRVTLAGEPLHLTATEYGLLAELSANAGRVLTHEHLLKRVWGEKSDGDVRPMRTIVSKLRRKLGEDAEHPRFIFTEPRVGFRMPTGNAPAGEPPATP